MEQFRLVAQLAKSSKFGSTGGADDCADDRARDQPLAAEQQNSTGVAAVQAELRVAQPAIPCADRLLEHMEVIEQGQFDKA